MSSSFLITVSLLVDPELLVDSVFGSDFLVAMISPFIDV
jgi:hypothetical protein